MARRTRSRIPGVVKLGTAIGVAGVGLGSMLATAIDPEMKHAAQPWRQATGEAEAPPPVDDWTDAPVYGLDAPEGYRPNLDYDAVVGSEWANPDYQVEIGIDPPPLGEALEAADEAAEAAAAVREADRDSPPADDEAASLGRKSRLSQGGLY